MQVSGSSSDYEVQNTTVNYKDTFCEVFVVDEPKLDVGWGNFTHATFGELTIYRWGRMI